MLGNSIVVDRKKFLGEICTVSVEPINKTDMKDIKIKRLQAMKSINESIRNNIYQAFIKCSDDLSVMENELKVLLADK